jgi:hypothetical protein
VLTRALLIRGVRQHKGYLMIGKMIADVLENALSADWGTVRTRLDAVCMLIERTPDCNPPLIAQRLMVDLRFISLEQMQHLVCAV